MRGEIAIGLHRDQHFCLRQPVECGAQILADRAADSGSVGDNTVERLVLSQPFDGSFRTNLGDTGNVIDRIADQRQIIDDALGRHTEFGDDTCTIELLVTHRIDQHHIVVDQLRKVFITSRNDGLHSVRNRLHRQRTDDVVRFDAIDH